MPWISSIFYTYCRLTHSDKKKVKDSQVLYPVLNPRNAYYVVNPDGTRASADRSEIHVAQHHDASQDNDHIFCLFRCQGKFLEPIDANEILNILVTHDLYLYMGHGDGDMSKDGEADIGSFLVKARDSSSHMFKYLDGAGLICYGIPTKIQKEKPNIRGRMLIRRRGTILQIDYHIAANPEFHEKTKHFKIKLFFLREKVSTGVVKTLKVKSANNVADIFTKVHGLKVKGKFDDRSVSLLGFGGFINPSHPHDFLWTVLDHVSKKTDAERQRAGDTKDWDVDSTYRSYLMQTQRWDLAERKLLNARRHYYFISCEKCKVVLEGEINQVFGNYYRKMYCNEPKDEYYEMAINQFDSSERRLINESLINARIGKEARADVNLLIMIMLILYMAAKCVVAKGDMESAQQVLLESTGL
ncbi:ribonuclease H-like domain-containing protein, partial [Tanacetum coccineum]